MNQSLKVFWFEILTLIRRFSFWFGLLGIPLVSFAILSVVSVVNQEKSDSTQAVLQKVTRMVISPDDKRPQGFVDLAGLIHAFPADTNLQGLIRYPNETVARKNLDNGTIRGYYVVPQNFIAKGIIPYYRKTFGLLADNQEFMSFERIIRYNLLGNAAALQIYDQPMQVNLVPLAAPEAPRRDQQNFMTFALPYAVMMLFYMVILGSSSLMLNSITKEKENRVIEALMVSVTPLQLLTGKILGLGVIGLFQVIVWSGSGLLLLTYSGEIFKLSQNFMLSPDFVIWAVVYFTLGYVVYASFMAGIGALVPNLREGSQLSTLVVLPMMLPLFLITLLIEEPNGWIAILFSLFPLTSPITMMMRLSIGPVPIWQNILAVLLLMGTAILSIRTVAGMFRAQTLLSGQAFNLKRVFFALLGKT